LRLGFGNRELGAALSRIAPPGIKNFFFVCDGSEAVESAMKPAQQSYAGRDERQRFKVISRRWALDEKRCLLDRRN